MDDILEGRQDESQDAEGLQRSEQQAGMGIERPSVRGHQHGEAVTSALTMEPTAARPAKLQTVCV